MEPNAKRGRTLGSFHPDAVKREDINGEDAREFLLRGENVCAVGIASTPTPNYLDWPPKVYKLYEEPSDIEIQRRVADRMYGRRAASAGTIDNPPMDRWPVYEVPVANIPAVSPDAAELQTYKLLDFSNDFDKAYILVSRWVKANVGRSLHFQQTGAAKLSSSVASLPVLLKQIHGSAKFCLRAEQEPTIDIDKFLEDSGADYDTARELRMFLSGVPDKTGFKLVGSESKLHVEAVLGAGGGSAIAAWRPGPSPDTVRIEALFGHDCLGEGPLAEEIVLKYISGKAAALGATKLHCRSRFTEDGRLYVPRYMKHYGFAQLPSEVNRMHFEEVDLELDDISATEMAMAREKNIEQEEIVHTSKTLAGADEVPYVAEWLAVLDLAHHRERVNAWCKEMGAATIMEVIECREEVADFLGLCEVERKTMISRASI